MQLIMSPASPFVRKTRIMLREAGLGDRIEELELATTPFATADTLWAANPLGKIPALLRDDAFPLFDSTVICHFMNELAGANFYPADQKWEVMMLEALATGIMDCTVSMSYEMRLRPEAQQSPDWIEAQWGKISSALDAAGREWMDHLNGPVTVAHMAMGAALGYIDLRHDHRNWRDGRDGLADWYAEFAKRASMVDTNPA